MAPEKFIDFYGDLVDWKNTDCSNCKYIRKSSFIKGCFEELKNSKEK